jgi:hypothetical protein
VATAGVKSIPPLVSRQEDKNSQGMAESSLHGVRNASLSHAASTAARAPIKIPRKNDGRHQTDPASKTERSLSLCSTSEAQQSRGDNGCGDTVNLSVQKDSYGKGCREKHKSTDGDRGRHLPSERIPAGNLRKQDEQTNTCTAQSGQDCTGSKGVTEAVATRRRDPESWSGVAEQAKLKDQPLQFNISSGQGAVSDRTARPAPKNENVPGPGSVPGEPRRKSLPDPSAVIASAKPYKSEVSTLTSTGKDSKAAGNARGSDPGSSSVSALPAGWTRHWSKTWSAHYIFNPKTGEQRWESGGPQEGVVNIGSSSGSQAKKPK